MINHICLFLVLVSFATFGSGFSGCVKSSGNYAQDRIIAKAKAKGDIAFDSGSTVKASTKLETKTVESSDSIVVEDVLTESITLSSEQYISRLETTSEGYETIDGQKYYCVHLKQQTKG